MAEGGIVRNGSMVRRRILGRRLRMLREAAELTLDDAAPQLDWSPSKLNRIETGQQSIDVHGVRSMLDLYDVGGDRWTELLDLTRETRQPGWWHAYRLGDSSYVGLETEAASVRDFTIDYVPGLLQTADYARALFTMGFLERTDSELENEVAVRMIRQERLSSADEPLELAAVLDESVLSRPIGGPDVLVEQLLHLADVAELPTVTVQVLPVATARSATGSGFTVLNFGELDEPDLVYLEHALGALRIEKEAEVTRARLLFDRLRSAAQGPEDSVALIRRIAEQT